MNNQEFLDCWPRSRSFMLIKIILIAGSRVAMLCVCDTCSSTWSTVDGKPNFIINNISANGSNFVQSRIAVTSHSIWTQLLNFKEEEVAKTGSNSSTPPLTFHSYSIFLFHSWYISSATLAISYFFNCNLIFLSSPFHISSFPIWYFSVANEHFFRCHLIFLQMSFHISARQPSQYLSEAKTRALSYFGSYY